METPCYCESLSKVDTSGTWVHTYLQQQRKCHPQQYNGVLPSPFPPHAHKVIYLVHGSTPTSSNNGNVTYICVLPSPFPPHVDASTISPTPVSATFDTPGPVYPLFVSRHAGYCFTPVRKFSSAVGSAFAASPHLIHLVLCTPSVQPPR